MRLSEKIQELSKWQDARDEAIEAFYEHKKCHPGKKLLEMRISRVGSVLVSN